jgi:DNA-binding CsgD family transcriptional regulator
MRRQRAGDQRLTAATTAVVVRALEGDKDKEIARVLGMPVDTVKGHLKTVFLRFGLRGRAELWRLLELPEVREEVAETSVLGLLLAWSFAYLAAVRAAVDAQMPELRERLWTRAVGLFAQPPCPVSKPAALRGPEVSELLKIGVLLRTAQTATDAGWPVEAAEIALEHTLELIEALRSQPPATSAAPSGAVLAISPTRPVAPAAEVTVDSATAAGRPGPDGG